MGARASAKSEGPGVIDPLVLPSGRPFTCDISSHPHQPPPNIIINFIVSFDARWITNEQVAVGFGDRWV